MKQLLLLAMAATLFGGCLEFGEHYTSVAPGIWRGVLRLTASSVTPNPKGAPTPEKLRLKFPEATEGELPFTFEISYLDSSRLKAVFINGDERIETTDIKIWHDRKTNHDSIRIEFVEYESYIQAAFRGEGMDGAFVITSKKDYSIPFSARQGKSHRFTTITKTPIADISGRWETMFEDEESKTPAVGEFKQSGNTLTGTFLTETGDYRYLAGEVQGNKLYLSCFDGSHVFLFEGKIDSTGNGIIGSFRSGKTYLATWEAKRNPNAALRDPNSLTKTTSAPVRLGFKDADGKTFDLSDPSLSGKVKVLQVMGTWCPNCHDETDFLVQYLKNHPDVPLAPVAIAFERHKDPATAAKTLRTYRQKMGMTYPILHGGMANKDSAAVALPFLDKIMSFPTTVILDKNNRVRRVHTGFSGPATSDFRKFSDEFDAFVRQLAKE